MVISSLLYTDQGLQSTVLFGEVLKSSVPLDHRNNLDSHQAGTSILLIPKFEPSESQPPEVDEIKLKTGTYRDEYIASYVAGPDGPILIKTEKPSSEDEDALTICLPGQSANPAGRKQQKKGRKGGKVPRKMVNAISEEEHSQGEDETMVIPPAVGSVAAMQESSLPGNLGSRRSYGQGYQDGMKQKRMKMAMTPSFAKVTGEVGFEGSLEEQDGGEYMEIEVKMEKDPGDCPEDLTTPDLKTVFLRNRDYSQLCNERLDGNLVVDRVVKREPDVTSCADTQHVLHVDGGQQIDRCPLSP
nr:uncharacterized protein LOC129271786 [Lytechinus pictus]